MPLDRTKFNALIDGTTVWNKTGIKEVILDPVDVELAKVVPGVWTSFTPDPFGSQAGSVSLVTNTSCKYLLDGKTLFVNFYLRITPTLATTFITMKMPSVGPSAAWDQIAGFWSMSSGFGGPIDVLPTGALMYLMRDVLQTNTIPATTTTIVGSAVIALS